MIDLQRQQRVIEREQLRLKILTLFDTVCETIKSADTNHDLEPTALAMEGAKGYMLAKWQRIKNRYNIDACDVSIILALDRLCAEFDERTRSSGIARM